MVPQMSFRHKLETRYLYALLQAPGIGKKTIQQVLETISYSPTNAQDLQGALEDIRCKISSIKVPTLSQLETGLREFEYLHDEAERTQVQIIGMADPEFPDSLKHIPNPPFILYIKGDIACLRPEQSIAIIGTRQPTEVGQRSGRRFAANLAQRGLVIVSGLAEGCDTAAHEGCLEAQGRTVAVMAHGLHMVYPSINRELAAQIVDTGGCLVSEYPLGQKPFKSSFVERDRLQSGLSAAVVIVQTDIKGGTMHTARFCLEQGKVLACLDFPIDKRSDKSRGNELLVDQGKAKPLWNPENINAFIQQVYGDGFQPSSIPPADLSSASELTLGEPKDLQGNEKSTLQVDDPQTLKLSLKFTPDEKRRFLEQCAAVKKTSDEMIAELVRRYINSDLSPISFQVGFLEKPTGHEQLSLTISDSQQLTPVVTQILEVKKPKQHVQTDLTQKELAARLKVSSSTISKQKSKPNFTHWSQEKDPEGLSWELSQETKKFQSF